MHAWLNIIRQIEIKLLDLIVPYYRPITLFSLCVSFVCGINKQNKQAEKELNRIKLQQLLSLPRKKAQKALFFMMNLVCV